MSGWVLVIAHEQASPLPALLSQEAIKAVAAAPSQEALDLIRAERPDAIFLDCQPPTPPLIEFCRRLKTIPSLRETPIVAVTADPDCRREAMAAGADDFLTPPFDAAILPTRLRVLMRFKQTIDAAALREVPVEVGMGSRPRILVAEDDELARNKLLVQLEAAPWTVAAVESAEACLDAARATDPDLIIASLDLSEADAFHLVARLRRQAETRLVPILLLFDDANQASLARALELGADDFIARPVVVEELMVRVRLQLRRKLVRDRLRDFLTTAHRPYTDRLTGVYSRNFLDAHLARLALPEAPRQDLSVLVLGIDRHADLVAKHGQEAATRVLAELGRRLLAGVRAFDLVARHDEATFVILLPQTPGGIAFQVAERLRRNVSLPNAHSAPTHDFTVSIGVAQPDDGRWADPADLIRRAGVALATAMGEGGNQVAAEPLT